MKNRVQTLAQAITVLNTLLQAWGISYNSYVAKDTTMYLTFDAKGKGSIVQLVDPNTKKLEGTTNFDGNKLDKGRYLVIDGIRGLYEATELTVGAAKWESDAIAAIKNGELSIIQDGEIFNLPLTEVFNIHYAAANGNGDDFRDLSHFPTIRPETVFKIQWTFPYGVVVPANVTAALARIEFRCHEVVLS